jgi:hypothetical protein
MKAVQESDRLPDLSGAHPSLRRAITAAWPPEGPARTAPGEVSRERERSFLRFLLAEAPELKVAFKDEGYPSLYWKLLGLFAWLLGVLQPSFRERWMLRISNSAGGWLLFPSATTHLDLQDARVFGVWRHELVHHLDAKKAWFWSVKYTLWPFPTLWSRCRANAEFRAYAQQLLTWQEVDGHLYDTAADPYAAHFWGSLYFWMWPWKTGVRARYERLIRRIRSGDLPNNFWHSEDELRF